MTERGGSRATDDDRRDVESEANTDEETDAGPDGGADHLDDVEDGAGCTEIWERLSERREE
ncbi:hypothetical protein [Halorubrum trapanicum]|uniref:hypothetical protein n=1 Tax=Halorubrum trapanicum TaxID=29284 RepID=UPI000BBB1C91|nr:hypothetical protein [Halorubrum trapanicum]